MQWLRVGHCEFKMLNGHDVASRSPSAWDVGHAGRDFILMQALSLESVHSFHQRHLFWSSGDSGRGSAYLCACNIFSSWAGMLKLGWGGHFSVFRIYFFFFFFWVNRGFKSKWTVLHRNEEKGGDVSSDFPLSASTPLLLLVDSNPPDMSTLPSSGVICFPGPQSSSSSSFCSELWKFNLRFFTVQRK